MWLYRIEITTPAGHVVISSETFASRSEAKDEIRRLKKIDGWRGGSFRVVSS